MQQDISRQRKIKAMLPLLLLPFCALFFYLFGGGSGKTAPGPSTQTGLNANLPSPQLEGSSLSKMSLYEQAAADSARARKARLDDPFQHGRNGGFTGRAI